jgi:hypothetical protein
MRDSPNQSAETELNCSLASDRPISPQSSDLRYLPASEYFRAPCWTFTVRRSVSADLMKYHERIRRAGISANHLQVYLTEIARAYMRAPHTFISQWSKPRLAPTADLSHDMSDSHPTKLLCLPSLHYNCYPELRHHNESVFWNPQATAEDACTRDQLGPGLPMDGLPDSATSSISPELVRMGRKEHPLKLHDLRPNDEASQVAGLPVTRVIPPASSSH